MKRQTILSVLIICCLLSGCKTQSYTPPDYSTHIGVGEPTYRTVLADAGKLKERQPVFALHEEARAFTRTSDALVKDEIWGYDLRYCDASSADLSVISDFNDISFNTGTIWPAQLPEGFDPKEILDLNKNPGLGVRALHEQGITGNGVGIAIIDQALFTEHEQYKKNLMLYDRIHCSDPFAQMHGAAVSSIAVGKDIGVAPGAKLYYIASTYGHTTKDGYTFDAAVIADCILRVLELNRQLPRDEKIRVISISRGYDVTSPGYEQLTEAMKLADKAGVFVLTTTTDQFYDFALMGMGRDYLDDPDDIRSYVPASWTAERFYANPESYQNFYLVPMGSRTYAGSTGEQDYEISHADGMSWAVPWFAGFYALCCQIKPELTPTEFITAVKDTAVITDIERGGTTYPFGNIVNPAKTIEILQRG